MTDIRHNCGLVVTHSLRDAYDFIGSLQHRGREATGIAAIGNNSIDVIKWKGPVDRFDMVDLDKIFPSPEHHTYFAHVRYATRGRKDKVLEDAHPHVIGGKIDHRGSHIIIRNCEMVAVHNGQVNHPHLDKIVSQEPNQLQTDCDTEALLHLFKLGGEHGILRDIPGAYTIAIADRKRKDVVVLRDPTGIKPGVLGMKDGKYAVASEDIAFRKNGGKFIENLDPGTIYYLTPEGRYRKEKVMDQKSAFCMFEWNYIADLDSIINGSSVRRVRELLGEEMAREFHPLDADLVTFLPRCPEVAAQSYAQKTGLPFMPVFYKMRGERAFQGSTEDDREDSIKLNLFLIPEIINELEGKVVIIMDDSVVRGNNARYAWKLLESAGVKKAYLASYTPPIGIIPADGVKRGCKYGVDTPPESTNFIARGRTLDEIGEKIGMPTYYLSTEGMQRAYTRAGMDWENLCTFCIGGKQPF